MVDQLSCIWLAVARRTLLIFSRLTDPNLLKSGSLDNRSSGGGRERPAGLPEPKHPKASDLGVVLDVLLGDATTGTGAFDLVNVDPDFAGQAPGRGSGGHQSLWCRKRCR